LAEKRGAKEVKGGFSQISDKAKKRQPRQQRERGSYSDTSPGLLNGRVTWTVVPSLRQLSTLIFPSIS